MRKLKKLLWCGFSIFLLGCSAQGVALYPEKGEKKELPLLEAKKVKLLGWDEEGERLWEIEALRATEFKDFTLLENPIAYLYREGKRVARVEAKKATLFTSQALLTLKGEVSLVSLPEGDRLFTSFLKWEGRKKKISTPEKVIIERKGMTLEGEGLVAELDLSYIEIKSKVKTYFGGKE